MAKLSRDEFLKKVRKSGDLMMFHQEFNDDYEIGLAAVSNWGQAIRYLSDGLRDKEEIVTLSAKDDPMGTNLSFASERLRDNFDIVSLFLYGNGDEYRYASDRLRDDEELVKLAVSNGGALLFASDRLKDNKELVTIAVSMNEENLKYASDRLRDDDDVVYESVHSHGESIKYASDRLRDDYEIVETAVTDDGGGLNIYYASERLKHDKNLGLAAVQHPPLARAKVNLNCPLKELAEELRDDEEIVEMSIRYDPHSLFYASDRLKDTYPIVEWAFGLDKSTIQYASERMKLNQTFIMRWLDKALPKSEESDLLKNIILTEFNELYAARGYIPSNESKIPKLILTNKNKKTEE